MNTLIVGASRGFGLELVRVSLQRGDRVVAVVREPNDALAVLAREFGSALVLERADVGDEAQLATIAQRLTGSPAGAVDRLVYNAATHLEQDRGDLLGAVADDVLRTIDINAVGAVRALKHLRPLVVAGGLIVLVSSEAGSIEQCWRDSEYGYCMSKAALNMFARLLEVRERKRATGVSIRTVHPGWLRTDMGGPNAHDSPREAALEFLTLLDQPVTDRIYTDRHGQILPW
jgi:NAD(P)-dependent dehydrogenase (short-subunit alcohol dehydrogenase family)